eukprot:6211369-Pleurochrysis_carterae.AAC.1
MPQCTMDKRLIYQLIALYVHEVTANKIALPAAASCPWPHRSSSMIHSLVICECTSHQHHHVPRLEEHQHNSTPAFRF